MNPAEYFSPLPNTHAKDEEIKRYAGLLDSLGIGLVVFYPDASPCLSNKVASKLIGNTPPNWVNDSGQIICADELPLKRALRTSKPVFNCVMALTNDQERKNWLSVNALPVFSDNGGVRRVLLTLTDINKEKDLQSEVKKLSVRDQLTGVYNQRHVMYLLENEIHRARRYGTPFTLAQVDIDHFLLFCEKHGPEPGERVLSGIGKLLTETMREIDIAGRIGDDEFLLVLPNVSLKEAMIGLERLRMLIETQEFVSAGLRITVSGGITEYTGENSETLLERAKSLLIHAREAGRNRFCLDGDILLLEP